MMIDRIEGNAELKKSVRMMLDSRRMTHSLLLVGEAGLGAGFAARCVAADYLYPAGGAPAEALLRGECCRAVGKPGDRDSGRVETGIVREAISITGMGSGGRYLVSQVKAMRTEIFNTSLSAEGRAVLLYHVERMNEESANALLKVMEEPPEGVLFIMTADSLAGVLPTIRSRCISFAVAPVSPEACARYWRDTKKTRLVPPPCWPISGPPRPPACRAANIPRCRAKRPVRPLDWRIRPSGICPRRSTPRSRCRCWPQSSGRSEKSKKLPRFSAAAFAVSKKLSSAGLAAAAEVQRASTHDHGGEAEDG